MLAFTTTHKSVYKSLRRQLLTSFLILVYLITIILPAQRTLAATAPVGCYDALPDTANMAAMAVPAANQSVTISKKAVNQAIYAANWQQKLTGAHWVEGVVWDSFLLNESKMPASVDNAYLSKFQDEYRAALNEYSKSADMLDHKDIVIHTILSMALDKPELAPVVPFVWQRLMHYAPDESLAEFSQEVIQSAKRYELSTQLLIRAPEIMADVYACAHAIPEVAEAFDKFHQEELNASILDDSMVILEKNLTLPVPTEIRGRIGEDGTLTISLDELKAVSQVEFDKIHETIGEMKETLTEIDAQQDVIVDYIKDQELKAKHQELMKKQAESSQRKLNAAKASLSVITAIAGQIDPKVAKQINVVGTATLQVGLAVNGWLKAVSGLKGLDKVASISTVMMTGNVLGAIMNIVSLFGSSEPTPEQMILEEIGKLRQQVNEMRLEMHDRFDRIDQGLNAIYTTMHERFDLIDIQLGEINGNVQEVQESLLSLDLKLSRIERNNFEFLNALGRRPLLEAINGAIGYEGRTGEPMPYQPEFVEFENTLHSWATIHAFDPVNAGPTQRDYSDGALLAELSAYPLDANINYINGWMIAHGLPALSNKPLPSPRDWLFASRAYTELGLEWSDHMQRIDPSREADLEKIGVELEKAMQNLSTQLTTAGPTGNSLLFTTVITHYENKLDSLNNAIQSVESTYINDLQLNHLQRVEPFNLYGGARQPLSYVSGELSNATCGDPAGYGTYALASDLRPLIPNFELYNVAEYLRLGKFSVCLSDEWIDPIEECRSDPERPQDPPYCFTMAQHYAILTVNFDGFPIMRQTLDDGIEGMPYAGAESYTKDNWTLLDDFKRRFGELTTADIPSPDVAAQQAAFADSMTAKVESALGQYQQGLYGRVLNEMSQGSLQTMTTELAGSKQLLDALVSLGLPRAVNGDEFLHAMLFGDQQLVDNNQIMHSYALSITQPITGVGVLVNPRLLLQQTADERTAAFNGMIDEYLAAITAKTHVEEADYLADTRRMLQLTTRIVQLGLPEIPDTPGTPTPQPPEPNSLKHNYLPSVVR